MTKLRNLMLVAVSSGALMALGLIEEAAFRPNLGGLALDLGVAGFDAILRARQAEFLASIGFEG